MAWEFAAIICKRQRKNLLNSGIEQNSAKWALVSPGTISYPPRIHFEGENKRGKQFEEWLSPVNKNYWEFDDEDEKEFVNRLATLKKTGVKKLSIKGKTRKTHFESPDLLSLINEAGKEGWEITGGIGFADGSAGQPETKYRMMRRET